MVDAQTKNMKLKERLDKLNEDRSIKEKKDLDNFYMMEEKRSERIVSLPIPTRQKSVFNEVNSLY